MLHKRIGEILVEMGSITIEQLKEALRVQKNTTEQLGRLLVDLGSVDERDVLRAMAKQKGVPFLEVSTMPRLAKEEEKPYLGDIGYLLVADEVPSSELMAKLKQAAGRPIHLVVSSSDDIRNLLQQDTLRLA